MNAKILTPLCFALIPLTAAAQQPAPKPALESLAPDGIVAQVGPRAITRAEHLREFNRLIPLNFYHARVPDKLRAEMEREALDSVIERNLIELDARDRGFAVTDAELRAEFSRALAKAGPEYADVTPERFDELFAGYRDMTAQRVLIDKNEARFQASIPPVTEDQLKAAYERRKDSLQSPLEARFRTLFFRIDPAASSFEANAAKDRMQRVRDGIVAGVESFESVAKDASEDIYAGVGGDMGFVTSADFASKEIGQAGFELADGELSEVLESMYGVHLLLRLETHPTHTLSFEEARGRLLGDLTAAHTDAARKAWLDAVRARYRIEVLVELPSVEEPLAVEPVAEPAVEPPSSQPTGSR